MAGQTLIVVPKRTATGYTGTFRALTSDFSLPSGTDIRDHLLIYT
ncbi:hypothetical protein [Streptomyces virginiae]